MKTVRVPLSHQTFVLSCTNVHCAAAFQATLADLNRGDEIYVMTCGYCNNQSYFDASDLHRSVLPTNDHGEDY